MLALNLGGVSYAWTSAPILALFAAGAGLGAGFVARLMTAPEPLIPIAILANPEARLAMHRQCVRLGRRSSASISSCPMFLQSVIGTSATNAGLSLMVLMVSLNLERRHRRASCFGRMQHYKTLPDGRPADHHRRRADARLARRRPSACGSSRCC